MTWTPLESFSFIKHKNFLIGASVWTTLLIYITKQFIFI